MFRNLNYSRLSGIDRIQRNESFVSSPPSNPPICTPLPPNLSIDRDVGPSAEGVDNADKGNTNQCAEIDIYHDISSLNLGEIGANLHQMLSQSLCETTASDVDWLGMNGIGSLDNFVSSSNDDSSTMSPSKASQFHNIFLPPSIVDEL